MAKIDTYIEMVESRAPVIANVVKAAKYVKQSSSATDRPADWTPDPQEEETIKKILKTGEVPQIEVPEIVPDAGIKLPNLLTDAPLVAGWNAVTSFWKLVLGTPEEKAQAAFSGLEGVGIDPGETAKTAVTEALQDPINQSWASQNYFYLPGQTPQPTNIDLSLPSFPEIKLPNIGEGLEKFGQYAAIIILGIAAIAILGRKK